MQLTIEIDIDEDLARFVAERLGMQMDVITDPDAPSVPATLEEVDTFLEGQIKRTVVAQYSDIIKSKYTDDAKAALKAQEENIDALINGAVSVGV